MRSRDVLMAIAPSLRQRAEVRLQLNQSYPGADFRAVQAIGNQSTTRWFARQVQVLGGRRYVAIAT